MIKNKATIIYGYKPQGYDTLKQWLIHIRGVLRVHGVDKTSGYLNCFVKMEVL